MAKLEVSGLEDEIKKLERVGKRAKGVIKVGIYDGVEVVLKAVKDATPADSGDLRDSVTAEHMKDKNGTIYGAVGFVGYDSNGVPNQLKAAVLEYGTSYSKKHAFVRKALNSCKQNALVRMKSKIDERFSEIIKE